MSTATELATDVEPLVAALTVARERSEQLVVRGGGSVLDRLPPVDAQPLSTAELTGVVDHRPEDLVVTVRAGTKVGELSALLAAHGQECPIEPLAGHGSTVGGRVATALAGPRQLQAGRVRDWLLRVRLVTAEARVVTAGGVTVKDVTGYDVCRLMTGSWGSLGVLVEVTLKLRPIPSMSRWFRTDQPAAQVLAGLYRPAAVVTVAGGTLVHLEEHPDDVAAQATAAGLEPTEVPTWPTRARVALDPARLAELTSWVAATGLSYAAFEGVGVCLLEGGTDALAAVGERAAALGGRLLVLDPEVPAQVATPADHPIAERVRAALDPHRTLLDPRTSR